jgi:hypothetical protein
MQGAFSYATDFNQDIGAWNVARATNMFSLFRQAVNFDQDLSRWQSTLDHFFKFRPSRKIMKSSFSSIFVPSRPPLSSLFPAVSEVTNIRYMFHGAKKYNHDVGTWDVSRVENMDGVFYTATLFNQPGVSNWTTCKCKDMSFMFAYAKAFNQDLSGWDGQWLGILSPVVTSLTHSPCLISSPFVPSPSLSLSVSSVEDMRYMFNGAASFDQELRGWNVSSVINMEGMFYAAKLFDRDITNWEGACVGGWVGE